MKNLLSLIILILSSFIENCIAQNIWEPTNGPHSLDLFEALVLFDGRLIISTPDGIYGSKDKGQNWEILNKGLDSKSSFARSMSAGPNSSIFAIIDQKLYRLDKDEIEWAQIQEYECCNLTVIANDYGGVYIRNYDNKTIKYSADGGISFQYILINMAGGIKATELRGNDNNFLVVYENSFYSIFRMNDDGSGLVKIFNNVSEPRSLFWHPAGYLFLITGDQKLLRMDRDGKDLIDVYPLNSNMKSFVIKTNGNLLAFTDSSDLESSDLGMSWFVSNSVMYKKIRADSKLLQHQTEVYLYHPYKQCLDNGLYKTSDGGNNWIGFEEFFQPKYDYQILSNKQNCLFTELCGNGKYSYSKDKGKNWQQFNLPMDPQGPSSNLVSCTSGELFVRVNRKLIKSVNFGLNWEDFIINGQSDIYGLFGNFNSSIYVIGDFGSFLSRDCGVNWKEVPVSLNYGNTGVFNPDRSFFTMIIDRANHIIKPDINYTNDDGAHWNTLNLQVAEIYEFTISRKGTIYFTAADYRSGPVWLYISKDKLMSYKKIKPVVRYDVLITGDDEVIYRASGPNCEISKDYGENWEPFESGLPIEDQHISTSFTFDEDNYLYLSFNGDVVYKTVKPASIPVATQDLDVLGDISIVQDEYKLNVNLKSKCKKVDGTWILVDISGRNILNGKYLSSQFSIYIHEIPNGIYFLKFDDPKLPVQKVVVEH
jgi:photosystem II stability/assembly factor-like uncharacterized protein